MRRRSSSLVEALGPIKVHMDELESVYKALQEAQENAKKLLPADALKLASPEGQLLSYDERREIEATFEGDERFEARLALKPIDIEIPGWDFDNLEDLKNLNQKTLPEITFRLARPLVSVVMGEVSFIRLGEDTTTDKGILQELREILCESSVRKKRSRASVLLGVGLFPVLWTALTSALMIRVSPYYALPALMCGVVWLYTFIKASSLIKKFVPAECSLRYKIDDPGFLASKGEAVSAKIWMVVITAIITTTVVQLWNYSAGHLFGAPVPVVPASTKTK